MSAILKQMDGGEVSSTDDAVMHELFYDASGVVRGCGVTYTGANQLLVASGYAYICGRLVEIEEETVLSSYGSSSGTEGELILKIDLLADDAAVLEARVPTEDLTQEDINGDGSVYEIQLATYTITDAAITDLTETYTTLNALTADGTVTDVQVVDSLPSDASDNPTTLYFVTG